LNLENSNLRESINSMYTNEELNQAVVEARKGLYTQKNVEDMVNKILEWDANNDGTIGLIEAIQALIISTDIKPIE